MKKIYIILAAALTIVLSACTSEDSVLTPVNGNEGGNGVPFSATISMPGTTRGLTEAADGKSISAAWAVNEQLALVHGKNVDVMTVKSVDATTGVATIEGTINNATEGEDVQVVYMGSKGMDTFKEKLTQRLGDFASLPKAQIDEAVAIYLNDSQPGTLAAINDGLDYRYATSTLTKPGNLFTFKTAVTPESQLAVWKITLSDGTNALNATELSVKAGEDLLASVKPASASDVLYVAMPAVSSKNLTIEATVGNDIYTALKPSVTISAGYYYQSSLALADMLHTPLTLQATEDGTMITVSNSTQKTFQYAKNGGEKTTVEGTDASISLNAGDIVQFFSTNATIEGLNIKPDKNTYVYGNVMSLIDDGTEGFANDKTIEGEYALRGLFKDASLLASHAMKKILLPATTLKDGCYQDMFNGCTGLTTAPDLPATTLATDCYTGMFKGCTGLTSLPEKLLPAKTLANNCYVNMFYGCTGLTSLPADLLPAKTLAAMCYAQMFHSCTGLTTLPANLLPATTLENHCYVNMFTGCSGLTTLPANLLPATTLRSTCYWGMFKNCTSLTTAPDLPAQTLVGSCYHLLFDGCTKLSSVKCLATSISASDCLGDWLKGAGTAEGCERKLYVDPSMINNGNWQLDTSGEDGKRWTTVANSVAASQ